MARIIMIAVGAAGLIATAALADIPDIAGRWNTTHGPITISRAAPGQYAIAFDRFPGTVSAALDDNILSGRWSDVAKVQPCAVEKNGTRYWGTFRVTFHGPPAIDRRAFQGIFAFCDNPSDGTNFSGEPER